MALILFSLILMVADQKYQRMESVRGYLSFIVAPLHYSAALPMRFVTWLEEDVFSYQTLLAENTRLKTERLMLQAQTQTLVALEKENRQLRALLQSSPRHQEKVLVAELLAIDTDADTKHFILSKGKRDGVYKGQAVLDAHGVFGQIIHVGPITSTVLLLTDHRSAIPIVDSKTGERAVAVGRGEFDVLELRHIPKTTTISVGDVLLTSGLGQRFPQGYPVGIVSRIGHNTGETFATVEVKPSAEFNKSRLVLLVWRKNDKS